MAEKCPCLTDVQSCCACISMHCDECHGHSKFVQGRFCSNCGRPLKAELTRDYVPKHEVSKARQDGYESGKREVVRELYIALYNEIIDARNSNFEAIKERETKHNVNRYEDMFCHYCDGKIHALDGIFYFITELTEKYMRGK